MIHYNELRMNSIQQVQLNLLKNFIAVCEKHQLTYYLFGGSALGAIRHQGFIPWDDDLDIAMPRPDFDRLMALKNEFKHPAFLQTIHTDRYYSYPYAKLRNSDTTFIETVFAPAQINHGIWVDIFPLDGMSTTKQATQVKSMKPYLLWFQWYFAYIPNLIHPIQWNKNFLSSVLINIAAVVFALFNLNNGMAKAVEQSCKKISWEKATLVGPYLTMYFNKEALPKEVFGVGTDAIFEGMKVKVPSDFHRYLSTIFGNYMRMPAETKRIAKHSHSGLNVKKSYIKTLEENRKLNS